MWYVAEIWHEREHTNLNGRMLLFFCWLFAILVPLGTPLMFRYFSWIVAFVVVMMLCFLPDLFCQLRYTAGRREALREYYGKMKHPGRKLAKIVLIAIALTVVNVALMFHFGFIHWA
ncbi:putative membrane protein [Bacteroides ovatus str. 3725 D9 iii]|nr:putative membrane protein [Bacteroides ovatus str. 3725 D9 iii]